jgi:Transposase IS66 family
VEVGCWSHARRYFVEALEAGDTRAALPLSLMGRLFEVEREADEQQVDQAERLRRRELARARSYSYTRTKETRPASVEPQGVERPPISGKLS